MPAIATPCLAYHEHNKLARLDEVLTALAGGDVALVSDAGTPAMSDPGFELANTCIAAALEDMLKILDDRRPTTDEN